MSGPPTGQRLGRALADVLGDTVVKARALTAPHEQAARDKARDSFLEAIEQRLAPLVRPMAEKIVNDPNAPPEAKALWAPVLDPTRQVDAILTLLASIFGVFGLANAILAPTATYYEQREFSRSPIKALSPAEAAEAVVKGWRDAGSAANEAVLGGVDADRFQTLVDITGNPPGPAELLTMWRRGIIGEGDVDRGIREGLIRNEWTPSLKQLFEELLSPAEAVEAAVQGHIAYGDMLGRLNRWGISQDNGAVMYQTAGTPLSRTEMEELWNRGEVGQADVEQAIRESRVKNKYIDSALKLRRRIPPERSVVMMLVRGVIDHDEAVRKLMQLGYDADDASRFVAEGSARKVAHHKEIAEGEVVAAYIDGLIGSDNAIQLLGRLGFTTDEAGFILAVADHRRDRANQEAAIVRVRSLYTGRKIERSVADSSLDRLQVTAEQKKRLIALWDIEREATVRVLTLGELNAAAERGFLAHDDYVAKAGHLGFAGDDAELLFRIATTTAAGAPRPNLRGGGP